MPRPDLRLTSGQRVLSSKNVCVCVLVCAFAVASPFILVRAPSAAGLRYKFSGHIRPQPWITSAPLEAILGSYPRHPSMYGLPHSDVHILRYIGLWLLGWFLGGTSHSIITPSLLFEDLDFGFAFINLRNVIAAAVE